MKTRWVLALIAGLAATAAYAGNVLATQPNSGLTTNILGKSTFGDFDVRNDGFWNCAWRRLEIVLLDGAGRSHALDAGCPNRFSSVRRG